MRILVNVLAVGLASAVGVSAQELVVSTHGSVTPEIVARIGERLLVGSWSQLSVIDLPSGLVALRQPQGSLIQSIVPSPDGTLVAIGTCDHQIHLRKADTLQLVRTLKTAHECTEAMAFTGDGKTLVIGVYGIRPHNGIRTYNLAAGTLTDTVSISSGPRKLALSPDGRRIAAADDKDTVTVFAWPSMAVERTFGGLEGAGTATAAVFFSPDGRYLGFQGTNGLHVFSASDGTKITLPGARLSTVSDIPPGGQTRTYTEESVSGSAARFLEDGRLAYVDGSNLLKRRLPSGPTESIELPEAPVDWHGHMGMTRQNEWLAIDARGESLVGTLESALRTFDTRSKQGGPIGSYPLEQPRALTWGAHGVLALNHIGGTQLWDTQSGGRKRDPRAENANAFAWAANGAHYVAAHEEVALVDAAASRVLASRPGSLFPWPCLAVQRDGSRIAVSTASGLDLLDASFRHQATLDGAWGDAQVNQLAISSDGKWIAAGLSAAKPSFRVWSTASRQQTTLAEERLTYGSQPPAFSPDSTLLATFVKGESLVIWAVGTWEEARRWKLAGSGRSLAFAPVGATLAVADDAGVALWNPLTGQRLRTFASPDSGVYEAVAWSPDAKYIASSGDDGVVRFWEAANSRLVATLYLFADMEDWILVAPNGSFDGTDRAVSRAIGWRQGQRITRDEGLSRERRKKGLWNELFERP